MLTPSTLEVERGRGRARHIYALTVAFNVAFPAVHGPRFAFKRGIKEGVVAHASPEIVSIANLGRAFRGATMHFPDTASLLSTASLLIAVSHSERH